MLYEEKRKYGQDLQTEYDSDQGDQVESGGAIRVNVSIVDKLLLDQEFDLEGDATKLLVRVTTDDEYKKAMKARKDWLLELKSLPICLEMEKTWEDLALNGNMGMGDGVNNASDLPGMHERNRKRRKVIKGLKKYTGIADEGERKFKGWSDNGHKAFEMWTMSIKTDVEMGRYKLWETAFREAQTKKEDAGGPG